MRKPTHPEPRLIALSAADLAEQRKTSSWMPQRLSGQVALDPARWSQRARQESYWRMVEMWDRQRRTH